MNSKTALELLDAFFNTGTELTFKRNDTIVPLDVESSYVYWIVSGCVAVKTYDAKGGTALHYLYTPQELFPVTQLFGRDRIKAAMIAFTPQTVVNRKRLAEFEECVDKQPEVLRSIVMQQNRLYGQLLLLNEKSSEQRIVKLLRNLGQRFSAAEDHEIVIPMAITVQEFADSVHLSRESAGKILTTLEKREAIIIGRQRIVIYPDKLRQCLA